ncbi:hypothetical protein GCM10009634_48620 [Saccharothrix xinjiangensis]
MAPTPGREEVSGSTPTGPPPGRRFDHPPRAQAPADPTRTRRGTDTSRRRFLRARAAGLSACDVFHVDRAVTLECVYVFFAVDVATRYVHIPAPPPTPTEHGPHNKPAT